MHIFPNYTEVPCLGPSFNLNFHFIPVKSFQLAKLQDEPNCNHNSVIFPLFNWLLSRRKWVTVKFKDMLCKNFSRLAMRFQLNSIVYVAFTWSWADSRRRTAAAHNRKNQQALHWTGMRQNNTHTCDNMLLWRWKAFCRPLKCHAVCLIPCERSISVSHTTLCWWFSDPTSPVWLLTSQSRCHRT